MLLAGLYLHAKDGLDTGAVAVPDRESQLYSAYGWYKFKNSKWSIFGRYDNNDPDIDLSGDAYEIFIGGIAYQVNMNLRLLADIDHTNYENDFDDPNRSKLFLQLQLNF